MNLPNEQAQETRRPAIHRPIALSIPHLSTSLSNHYLVLHDPRMSPVLLKPLGGPRAASDTISL